MANFEIDTTQETVNQALRKIETSDPVHANVYNLLFEQLINNDAFLERLANKMIQKAMVAHVLDSNNANMVLGADQAPALTALIDVERERITRLNSDLNWTLLGEATNQTKIALPSNFSELLVYTSLSTNKLIRFQTHILKKELSDIEQDFRTGAYGNTTTNTSIGIGATTGYIYLKHYYDTGTNVSKGSSIRVYYTK